MEYTYRKPEDKKGLRIKKEKLQIEIERPRIEIEKLK